VVLRINQPAAVGWSDLEVVERWHRLFKGSIFSQRFCRGETLRESEKLVLFEQITEWRERLMSLSWFMRCTNEAIAREANKEDEATGRFWEGRFKSQALLDEKALAACMVYVDLNPIRACMAKSPETSDFTSVKQRIGEIIKTKHLTRHTDNTDLFPFAGYPRKNMPDGLPFRLTDYVDLVEWTGRIIREGKRGAISAALPPLLSRLDIDARHWLYLSKNFESPFSNLIGSACQVRKACEELGKQWVHGVRQCEALFSSS